MTPKQIAKKIISQHFAVGSVGYDEALECALITAQHMNTPDIYNAIKEIQAYEVRNGNLYQNKPVAVILKQMELFNI